jgi:hypothetical protein
MAVLDCKRFVKKILQGFFRGGNMKTQEAIDYYGGVKRLAAELGVWPHAIIAWGEYPPKGRQYELQVKTGGNLIAEPEHEGVNHGRG